MPLDTGTTALVQSDGNTTNPNIKGQDISPRALSEAWNLCIFFLRKVFLFWNIMMQTSRNVVLCTFLSFKDLIPWINATSHYKLAKNFIFKDVGASTLYFLCSSDLYRSLENLYNNGPRFTNIRKASLSFPRHWALCLAWSTKIFTLKIIFFTWTSCGAQYNTITSLKSPKAEPAWI